MSQCILFVGHDANIAGAQAILLAVIRYVKKHTDYELVLLLGESGPLINRYRKECKVVGLWESNWKIKVPKKINLVYSNTCGNKHILSLLSLNQCPHIVHLHEQKWVIESYYSAEEWNWLKGITTKFVACSDAVYQTLTTSFEVEPKQIYKTTEFVEEEKVERLSKIVPESRIRSNLGIAKDDVWVGVCAISQWRKGIDVFLPLAEEIRRLEKSRRIFVSWVGINNDTIRRQLEFDLKRKGLSDRVTLIPIRKNPYPWIAAMDGVLLLSREDPFPLIMIEATVLKKPVFYFEETGGADEFFRYDDSLASTLFDLKGMASKIVTYFDDKDRNIEINLKDAFSSKQVCRGILNEIECLISETYHELLKTGSEHSVEEIDSENTAFQVFYSETKDFSEDRSFTSYFLYDEWSNIDLVLPKDKPFRFLRIDPCTEEASLEIGFIGLYTKIGQKVEYSGDEISSVLSCSNDLIFASSSNKSCIYDVIGSDPQFQIDLGENCVQCDVRLSIRVSKRSILKQAFSKLNTASNGVKEANTLIKRIEAGQNETNEQLRKQSKRLISAENEVDRLKNNLKEMDQNAHRLNDEKKVLSDQLRIIASENKVYEESLSESETKSARLSKELKASSLYVRKLHDELSNLKNRSLIELKKVTENLDEQVGRCSALEGDLNQLEKEKLELLVRSDELVSQVNSMERLNENLIKDAKLLEDRIDEHTLVSFLMRMCKIEYKRSDV